MTTTQLVRAVADDTDVLTAYSAFVLLTKGESGATQWADSAADPAERAERHESLSLAYLELIHFDH